MNNKYHINKLKRLKKIISSTIEILEEDKEKNEELINYICETSDEMYEEIKRIISKSLKERRSEILIHNKNSEIVSNMNNFINNIYYY